MGSRSQVDFEMVKQNQELEALSSTIGEKKMHLDKANEARDLLNRKKHEIQTEQKVFETRFKRVSDFLASAEVQKKSNQQSLDTILKEKKILEYYLISYYWKFNSWLGWENLNMMHDLQIYTAAWLKLNTIAENRKGKRNLPML